VPRVPTTLAVRASIVSGRCDRNKREAELAATLDHPPRLCPAVATGIRAQQIEALWSAIIRRYASG
jgi:hypothetical protein